jgi:hypothetical protein
MSRVFSTVFAVFLCVSSVTAFAAPQGQWGERNNHNYSNAGNYARSWGTNLSQAISSLSQGNVIYHKPQEPSCHHPHGPFPGDDRAPVTPVPPPVIIVDPVRPSTPPVVRDHRQPPVPPVVRDHRDLPAPVIRDHRQGTVGSGPFPPTPPIAPRANAPWRGGMAQGGVSVSNAAKSGRSGRVETITGTGPVEIITSGVSAIGSSVIDFFSPDLGAVPPNRDHRTSGGTSGTTTRDHR